MSNKWLFKAKTMKNCRILAREWSYVTNLEDIRRKRNFQTCNGSRLLTFGALRLVTQAAQAKHQGMWGKHTTFPAAPTSIHTIFRAVHTVRQQLGKYSKPWQVSLQVKRKLQLERDKELNFPSAQITAKVPFPFSRPFSSVPSFLFFWTSALDTWKQMRWCQNNMECTLENIYFSCFLQRI